jgi:ABC-type glycerol-3-phosphate transport system substrate-binding protein
VSFTQQADVRRLRHHRAGERPVQPGPVRGGCQDCHRQGVAAFANANGDRDYPGQIVPTYLLLSKLGPEDLVRLWKGEITFSDPRVADCFTYFEDLVKMKAFPATFSSMTLSESHNYFHTQRKAAMFPVPSWYTARAFVPPDKGGQPKDFQLGFLGYPTMTDGKGPKHKYLDPGGSQTAAQGQYRDLAIAQRLYRYCLGD